MVGTSVDFERGTREDACLLAKEFVCRNREDCQVAGHCSRLIGDVDSGDSRQSEGINGSINL